MGRIAEAQQEASSLGELRSETPGIEPFSKELKVGEGGEDEDQDLHLRGCDGLHDLLEECIPRELVAALHVP